VPNQSVTKRSFQKSHLYFEKSNRLCAISKDRRYKGLSHYLIALSKSPKSSGIVENFYLKKELGD